VARDVFPELHVVAAVVHPLFVVALIEERLVRVLASRVVLVDNHVLLALNGLLNVPEDVVGDGFEDLFL